MFATAELPENIMLPVPAITVLITQSICKKFCNVVKVSIKVHEKPFLRFCETPCGWKLLTDVETTWEEYPLSHSRPHLVRRNKYQARLDTQILLYSLLPLTIHGDHAS